MSENYSQPASFFSRKHQTIKHKNSNQSESLPTLFIELRLIELIRHISYIFRDLKYSMSSWSGDFKNCDPWRMQTVRSRYTQTVLLRHALNYTMIFFPTATAARPKVDLVKVLKPNLKKNSKHETGNTKSQLTKQRAIEKKDTRIAKDTRHKHPQISIHKWHFIPILRYQHLHNPHITVSILNFNYHCSPPPPPPPPPSIFFSKNDIIEDDIWDKKKLEQKNKTEEVSQIYKVFIRNITIMKKSEQTKKPEQQKRLLLIHYYEHDYNQGRKSGIELWVLMYGPRLSGGAIYLFGSYVNGATPPTNLMVFYFFGGGGGAIEAWSRDNLVKQ